MVIQIAAGIVLAVIIPRFWRQALALALALLIFALIAVAGLWLEGTAVGSKLVALHSLAWSRLSLVWWWLTGTLWGLGVLTLFISAGLMWVGIYFNKPRSLSAPRNGKSS